MPFSFSQYASRNTQYETNWLCFFKSPSIRHGFTQRGLGLRPWPQPKIKDRLLQIRRMFFAFAFLFTASFSCEGGEKRTTAKNKRLKRNNIVIPAKAGTIINNKPVLSKVEWIINNNVSCFLYSVFNLFNIIRKAKLFVQ